MSIIDIESLFTTLSKEFEELKNKIEEINRKYDKLENIIKKQSKFQCYVCKRKFEKMNDLKNHKENEDCGKEEYQCDDCEKSYKTNDKLEMHKKVHQRFECEECDNQYKFERNLMKHMEAVHGNRTLYCHFYNNDKDCPYDDECVFAHEDSPKCKFGKGCERILCMFQHEEENEDEDSDDDEMESENSDDEKVNDDFIDIDYVMKKVEESMNKVGDLIEKHTAALKCDSCEFIARNSNGLTMHKKAKHTNSDNQNDN